MPDSVPVPDALADAARALDDAVARLERASEARAAALPAAEARPPDHAALAQAAARIDALILRLDGAGAKPAASTGK